MDAHSHPSVCPLASRCLQHGVSSDGGHFQIISCPITLDDSLGILLFPLNHGFFIDVYDPFLPSTYLFLFYVLLLYLIGEESGDFGVGLRVDVLNPGRTDHVSNEPNPP